MAFFQTGPNSIRGVSYRLSYDFAENGSSHFEAVLDANLELEFGASWTPPIDLFFDTSEDIHSSITTLTHSEHTIQLSLDLYVTSTDSSQKLVLHAKDSEQESPLHFTIPAPPALHAFQDIVKGEEADAVIDKLEEHYVNRLIYESLEDASQCLSTEHYFDVKNSLAGGSPNIQSFIDTNRHASFRNMVAGESKGTYHEVSSVSELRSAIQLYNEYVNLADVTFDQVIGAIFDDICENSNLKDYQPVILESDFHEACSEVEEHHFAILLALLVDSGNLDAAKTLTVSWSSPPSYEDYERKKQEALDEGFRRYDVKAQGFRELLFDAADDNHEFKFISANYLFWAARRYSEDHEHLAIQPQLFSSAKALADEVRITELAKRAEYQYNITRGHQLRPDDLYTATARYRDALASGQEIDRYHLFANPFRYLAETQVRIHKDNGEYEDGLERLENQIQLLEEAENIHPDQKEYTLNVLRAWEHDLKAHSILNSQGIATALQSAKAELGNAIQAFDDIGRESLRDGAIARRIELEAIGARLEGDFEQEASKHEQYVRRLPDAGGTPYHKSQKWICKAKAALLRQEFTQAEGYFDQLEEELGFVHERDRPLRLIINVALDYDQGIESDPTPIFRELYDVEEDEHLLHVQSDYSAAIAQILAAQRFLQWPIDTELLDTLVDRSLRHAFIPSEIDDIPAGELQSDIQLEDLSIGRLWRERLPLNVFDKLQTAELTAETSPDWDTPIEPLMRSLERQLAAVVEYHGKQYWGDSWRHNLAGEDESTPTEEIHLSLGHFFEFFYRDAGKELACADSVTEQYEAAIISGVSIKDIRDILAHGKKLQVAESEEDYQQIRDAVLNLMRTLSRVTPVPGFVRKQLPNSAYIKLLYNASTDLVIVASDTEFVGDTIYYFPPDQLSDDLTLSVAADDIIQCEDHRGLQAYLDT